MLLMGRIPRRFLRHRITIEPLTGQGSTGPVYGTPVPDVRCLLDEQTRQVRTPTGDLVTSGSTAYCEPGTTAPAGSRVTLPGGRVTTVIAEKPRDGGGLGTPDHVEIQLQ